MAKTDPVLRKNPFATGQEIYEAGILILQRLPDRRIKPRQARYRAWVYWTRCLNCGHERRMYHPSILQRAAGKIRVCHSCARSEVTVDDDKPLSFDYDKWIEPPWEVPSSVR